MMIFVWLARLLFFACAFGQYPDQERPGGKKNVVIAGSITGDHSEETSLDTSPKGLRIKRQQENEDPSLVANLPDCKDQAKMASKNGGLNDYFSKLAKCISGRPRFGKRSFKRSNQEQPPDSIRSLVEVLRGLDTFDKNKMSYL